MSALGPVAKAAIPAVVKLIQDGQNDPSRSLFVLARIGPDSIPALIQLLQNTNDTIRANAAGYLGNFRAQAQVVTPALITCLDDPDEAFRSSVASDLARLGPQARAAIPKLLQLAQGKYPEVSAVHALVAIDYDSTQQAMLNELRSTDPQKRANAACILGWIEDRGGPAVPALIKCLKDEDQHVRAETVLALGRIRMEPDLVVPALLEKLKEDDSMLLTWTVLALANFGQRAKPAVPAIQDLLAHHKLNETYRAQVLQALGAIDPETTNSVAN